MNKDGDIFICAPLPQKGGGVQMIVWSKEGGLRSMALSCYGYPESLAENIEDIKTIAMILSATTVSISFHSVGPRLRAHCAIRGMFSGKSTSESSSSKPSVCSTEEWSAKSTDKHISPFSDV